MIINAAALKREGLLWALRVENGYGEPIMQTEMTHVHVDPDFHVGDAVVVLYQGLYDGMAGSFLGLAQDPKWADIREADGSVHAHPLAWLRHAAAVRDPMAVRKV